MATPLGEMNASDELVPLVDLVAGDSGEKGGKKRLSVERIYQRKTQLEHILIRPDTYIGSVEETTESMYVFDDEKKAILKRQVTFVPGLYKIFDEILVNAADNKQRDRNMTMIKIVIDPEDNLISVWNNGRGIPVEMHAKEKMYVPELIFGTLLTSSNYNDDQKKVTGGRNGYGAKLCNIFSTEFTVETACSESGKLFKQTWKGNMGKAGKTTIRDSKSDFTKVSFKPDLAKFKMTHLDKDTVAIMTRRAYDLAGCTKGVSVYLNGTKLPVKTFRDYVELYLRGISPSEEEEDLPRKIIHEVVNPRWEVAITASPCGFQQSSFVNSIATTKGGTHIGHVVDQVVSKLLESAKKKNKGGMDLKPFHIKGHIWIFINCLIENPTFDSQTKENMTLKVKSFGSTCSLSDKFIKQAMSCGVIERVLNWARAKSQAQIAKKQSGSKHTKLRGIPKLDDANDAGGKNSMDCTLIVTEGDSAKTLAVSGLGVVGRDQYGVFPLRGKLLNVREATHNQIMGNEEISNVVKILGLQYSKKYAEPSELKSLRYGKLMVMADQDQDGSHIKGLVINFIHHNWPNLLKHNFMEEFITPIVKASKGREEIAFFSLPEFERWKAATENHHTWKIKYYKGLGTSTAKEAKEYFSDMERHRIPFQYSGSEDDQAIVLAFSKKFVDARKEWLTSWLQQRRERRQDGLNESFLYGEATSSVSYSDFINKELILFSNMDNERSIPSMVDGLKPGQRKVMFTCFKRNDKREIKVAQLAGSVAEHSAYHHGEQSLMSTIINLAQNFVGSNNVNLLQPVGQFGTRLHGGKDAASPRYIFTMLSLLARCVFHPSDNPQLNNLFEDNMKIEPEWYCPILPMVLVNGSDGIGTGYSTTIPNYNPREIIANIKRMMAGQEPIDMQPWYKNFGGTIAHIEPSKYMVYGNVARLSPTSLEITELPIRTWTQVYKENVLELMLHGNEKNPPFITDYKEYHTDTTVKFVVTLSADKMMEAEAVGFHKKFKLESSLTTSNLVLFDRDGCLKKYPNVMEILKEFYEVRLELYRKRKDWLVGQLEAEAAKLTNQARFIMEKIEGKVVIENKRKAEMIEQLKSRGYRSDPVKAWKAESSDDHEEEGGAEGEEQSGTGDKGQPDYNYLLSMQLWSLTREKKEELLKNRDKKVEELRILKEKMPKDLWKEDIDVFMEELERVETLEKEDEEAGAKITVKKKKTAKGKSSFRQTKLASGGEKNSLEVTKPSPFAEAIEPSIPEFNANPKKPGGGRKRAKAEPKEEPGSSPSKESDGKEEKEGVPAATKKAKTEAAAVEVVDGEESKMEVKPSAPAVKRKTVVIDDSEMEMSEDSDDDDFELVKKKKPVKSKSKTLLAQTKLTLEAKPKTVSAAASKKSAESAAASKKSTKSAGGAKATKKKAESAVTASEHEPTKKPASKKQPPKPVVGKKRQIRAVSLSSDEEDDGSPPLKKSPVKEKKRAKKALLSDDDDVSPPVKKVAAKKSPVKKKAKKTISFSSSSEEGEEDSDIEIQPLRKRVQRQAATRAKNKVQYLIDSSEGEDSDFQPDDDDMM